MDLFFNETMGVFESVTFILCIRLTRIIVTLIEINHTHNFTSIWDTGLSLINICKICFFF